MDKPRSPRSIPPELPAAHACEVWLDHTLALLLANETEAALRWGAAVVGRDGSPSALILTSRLLEQMGRTRAAAEGLGVAVESAVDAGNVPLAIAALQDLRGMGVDVGESLDRLASTFCRGSARLDETQALSLAPHHDDLQPLSPFLTGPALASTATQILRGAAAARDDTAGIQPPTIAPLPLFSALGPVALRDLLEAFEVITIPAGHRVLSEGERGTAVYVIARGEVEVSRRQHPYGVSIVVARLGEGAFVGEMVLVSDLPCAASVVALRPSILLMARREALRAVTTRHPEVAQELAAHCRRQLVANLGRAAPVLTRLPAKERAALLDRFEMRTFEKGQRLTTNDEESSGLHLVATGEVAIVARDGGERVVLATVGAGETLGEVELVLCRPASADAVAVRPTTTLFLPRAEFLVLAADYPVIAHGLYMTALRRQAETALAMAATAVVADGDLLEEPVLTDSPPKPSPTTLAPTTASRPATSRRRGALALPALIGAGALVAASIPVGIALRLGPHREGSAVSALEARNVRVATEPSSPSEPPPDRVVARSAATLSVASKPSAWTVQPRTIAAARAASSSATVFSPDPPRMKAAPVSADPPRTNAAPEAGPVDPPTGEFGGRE